MTPKNEQRLRGNRPRLFCEPRGKAALVPFAVDGFAVGDGWFAILDAMAAEIEQVCARTGSKLPTVLQIKEKFGTLRVYVSDADEDLNAIIARAEVRSAVSCEDCGGSGRLRRKGWLRTLCDAHDTPSQWA